MKEKKMQFLDNLFFLPRSLVVSDLTLKSVPCPSSPGVVPHSQAGGGGEGQESLPGSGVKNMEANAHLTQATAL